MSFLGVLTPNGRKQYQQQKLTRHLDDAARGLDPFTLARFCERKTRAPLSRGVGPLTLERLSIREALEDGALTGFELDVSLRFDDRDHKREKGSITYFVALNANKVDGKFVVTQCGGIVGRQYKKENGIAGIPDSIDMANKAVVERALALTRLAVKTDPRFKDLFSDDLVKAVRSVCKKFIRSGGAEEFKQIQPNVPASQRNSIDARTAPAPFGLAQ